MNIVPTFPSPRHVNFQRCAFQTKLEGGMRAECAASGLENAAQARLSVLRTIVNCDLKNKIKCRPSVQTDGRALCCVRSRELRLRSSVWERAQKAWRSSPRRLSNTSNNTLVFPPPTLLTVSVFSSRDLCSPPFVLQEKSLREDVEAQQPLSCSFVPTRTCQLINCASRLCAAPQLLCLSTRGCCCCCIGCKFQKGGSTMTSSRRAAWALYVLPRNVLIRRD